MSSSAKARVLRFPEYEPIRSTRSKSGSIRTWSSSARAANFGGDADVHALLSRAR
jgi:hypothetical protein